MYACGGRSREQAMVSALILSIYKIDFFQLSKTPRSRRQCKCETLSKSIISPDNKFMKTLISLCLILFPLISHSNCKVFIPEKVFLHAGLEINFDFSKILKDKNYYEVLTNNEGHDYEVHIQGIEPDRNHFHFAETLITFLDSQRDLVKAGGSVRCFTQNCGVGDFAKSFNKSMKSFAKNIPPCQDSVR
jgi:hypothetical protein